MGGILLAWFGSTCPLDRRATSNQCRVVLGDYLYLVMKHFYPDQDRWEWSLPGWQCLHPQGTRGHWMVWWVWKWCESYAMAFTVTKSQPNWTPRFWTDVLDSTLHHHHQNTKWGNVFWMNAVHPSSRDWRINAKAHWCCSGGTWWPNTLLRHFMLVFPLICHPSVDIQVFNWWLLFMVSDDKKIIIIIKISLHYTLQYLQKTSTKLHILGL